MTLRADSAPPRAATPDAAALIAARRRIEAMERLLENSIAVPGFERKIGLDAVVGLIPGIGDAISAALGAYLIWEARNLGLSKWQLWRMVGNLGVDTAIGVVPVVGDLFDVVFRSNSRNLKLLKRHLDRHHPAAATIEGVAGSPDR